MEMLDGHDVLVRLIEPEEVVIGILQAVGTLGVYLSFGGGNHEAVHFYPNRRIMEIVDRGRTPR